MKAAKHLVLLFLLIYVGYYFVIDANNYFQTYLVLNNRNNITFHIDSDFTKEEIEVIKNATKLWTDKVNTIKINIVVRDTEKFEMFYFGSDERPTIYKAIGGFKYDVGKTLANSSNVIGISLTTCGDIFIFTDGKVLEQVVAHEIGHILIGKPWHSKNKNSLMFPISSNESKEIGAEEIEKIKETK